MQELLIIPAGGDQTRWSGIGSKQLCVVDGERLLERLQHQFSPGRDTVLLARADDIKAMWSAPLVECNGTCLAESLLDTLADCWQRDVLIVHGDVWLTDMAAELIGSAAQLRPDSTVLFFGTYQEIFACYWRPGAGSVVKRALNRAFLDFKVKRGRGQLWTMYRSVRNRDLHIHDVRQIGCDPDYFSIMDGSTDFDTVEYYEHFIKMRSGDIDG